MKKLKLIPFTIEAWKAGGKPVIRDGREVKHLTNFETDDGYPLGGVIHGTKATWRLDGIFNNNPISGNNLMLEVEDTEKELYLVVISDQTCGYIKNEYKAYVSDDIEYAVKQANYLTHLKLPPCNS